MTHAIRILPLLLLLLFAACSDSTGPDGACVAAVNVDGVLFGAIDAPSPSEAELSDEPYLTITRNTGCLDEGQPGGDLSHAESNFLPVGSELFEIGGFAASERLAYWADSVEEWQVLGPMP